MQRFEFLQPLFVDFVGRERGRGAGLERPGVPFRPTRLRPHAGIGLGTRAFGLQLGKLALECGDDFLLGHASGGRHRRGANRLGRFFERTDIVRRCRLDARFHRGDCLVEQEVGRDHAEAARPFQPLQLTVKRGIDAGEPVEIVSCVRLVCERLRGIEEARHVEIGADILDHDVRRVAPAADCDIAIGLVEPFGSGRKGAAYDFETGLLVGREAAFVEPFHLADDPAQIGAILALPGDRLIFQHPAPRGMIAGIDTQAGCPLGLILQHPVGNVVEPFVGRESHGPQRRASAAGGAATQRQGGGCGEPGKGLAAGEGECGHATGVTPRATPVKSLLRVCYLSNSGGTLPP